MSLGSVKLIKKPPPVGVMKQAINQEITKQLQQVGKLHVGERRRIVANFEHKPVFGYRIAVTEQQITLTVLLENSGDKVSNTWTIGDLWKALDQTGTRPHTITSKNGVLVFQWNGPGSYSPKTRPIARFGGPGTVQGGKKTVRKFVKHPGFAARKFSENINRRLKRAYDQAIDRGVRLGFRRIEKP